MKPKHRRSSSFLVIAFVISAISVFAIRFAYTQQVPGAGQPARELLIYPSSGQPRLDPGVGVSSMRSRNEAHRVLSSHIEQLKNAETEEAKEVVREKIRNSISAFFDKDLKQRELEIAAVEDRVKKLREQLQKRTSSKEQIVELQMKVIEYEASGLGLFSAPRNKPGPGIPYGGSSPAFVPRRTLDPYGPTLSPESSGERDR